uniref:ABC transporter domain-containing protein n=1 Tax=viral metagenome TaxID=1070528 RepID=A0A6C0J3C1_9ZZZZ
MDKFNIIIGKSNYTSNMIQVDKFSVSIGHKKLYDDSELVLAPGNMYGLIGKNGCGKSTLLKMIKENKIPVNRNLLILYVEQELENTDKTPLQILIESNGIYFKKQQRINELDDIMSTDDFQNMDIADSILEEYQKLEELISGIHPEAEEANIRKILNGLGFSDMMMEQSSRLFSGGWKMRISLARALYIEPDILLLDEPTNHLDLDAVVWLGDYLENSFISKNKIGLLVSHNVGFLNQVCTNILNIEKGKLVTYKGNYGQFKYKVEKKYRQKTKEWTKLLKKKKGKSNKEFNDIVKRSGLTEPEKPYNVNIEFCQVQEYNNNIISVKDVSFSYENKLIFKNLDFGLDTSSRVTLIGKNGAGKSTLLKLVVGEIEPDHGNIIKRSGLRIGYYHQHFEDFLPKDKNPIQFLESMVPEDLITVNKTQTVRKYLGTLGLEGSAHTSVIGDLSGGQKARVALVSLIFQKPSLILFDEPTNHLDIETVEALIEGLKTFEGGIMLITHESEIITNLESELWILENNGITYYNNSFEDYCDSIIN